MAPTDSPLRVGLVCPTRPTKALEKTEEKPLSDEDDSPTNAGEEEAEMDIRPVGCNWVQTPPLHVCLGCKALYLVLAAARHL